MKSCKIVYCLLFLGFLGPGLLAQIQVLQRGSASLKAQVDVLEESFKLVESASASSLIEDFQMELKDFELLLNYRLAPLQAEQYYQVSINILLDGKEIVVQPGFISGNRGRIDALDRNQPLNIVWTKLLEQYLNLKGELTVTLSTELWGKPVLPYGIDCEYPPQFDFRQKLPYYASGVVGIGAAGSGYLLFNNAKSIYENEYLTSTSESEASEFYDKANQQRHTALILIYSGAGLVLVDAIGYLVQSSRYKKRKEAYDNFCTQNNVSLRPAVIIPSGPVAPTQFGLKLSYGF